MARASKNEDWKKISLGTQHQRPGLTKARVASSLLSWPPSRRVGVLFPGGQSASHIHFLATEELHMQLADSNWTVCVWKQREVGQGPDAHQCSYSPGHPGPRPHFLPLGQLGMVMQLVLPLAGLARQDSLMWFTLSSVFRQLKRVLWWPGGASSHQVEGAVPEGLCRRNVRSLTPPLVDPLWPGHK